MQAQGRDYHYQCAECHEPAGLGADLCPVCAGPLIASLEAFDGSMLRAELQSARTKLAAGIWQQAAWLPKASTQVSLGEGDTPLIGFAPRVHGADADKPAREVWLKLESLNPTLSFKDRAMALAASTAKDRGLQRLVVASTGNAAASAAAYAAAAGLGCRVLVGTASNAATKLEVCRNYGAEVIEIAGDYSDAYEASRSMAGDGAMNVSTTYQNPLLAEAYRTVAWELFDQLGRVPAAVVVPIGAGPLLRGIGVGFAELRSAGLIETVPRLIGVQAQACAPLARAWRDRDWRASLEQPVAATPTTATAIADALRGYEQQGLLTLQAVADADGSVVAVSEEAIARASRDLRWQGHWVEPAAATALAALRTGEVQQIVSPGEDVVLLMTGHGIKAPAL